jgi:hypothetical protein
MERVRSLGLCLLLAASSACAPELDELPEQRSARGTLGEEVYKVLCRRIAGVELPDDTAGQRSQALCLGDAATVAHAASDASLPPRLVVLARRRAELARAVDDMLPDELADELELLMREMLPFYEPPAQRLPASTRALAALLRSLAADEQALAGLESLGRDGMVGPEAALGPVRALLSSPGLADFLVDVMPSLTSAGEGRSGLETLLSGLALELATSQSGDDGDLAQLERLLQRPLPAAGEPWLVARRDARGLPVPTAAAGRPVPFPFRDDDADGLADAQRGRFEVDAQLAGPLPAPFSVPGEGAVRRDALGRALAMTAGGDVDGSRPLFETFDARASVLGALVPEAGKLFAPDTAIAVHLARVVPAVFGPEKRTSRAYGQGSLTYSAPDAAQSPLVDLVHASVALLEQPAYDQSLDLALRLLLDHESTWVSSLEPLLALERRTRKGQDAYPEAELAEHSLLCDELFFEAERLSRRRKSADGETALEALMRAALGYGRNFAKPGAPLERIADLETLRHQGAVLATLMRFKDEWRSNPRGESKRGPDEDAVRGAFRVPVDREQPDAPVSCGKDGCGGLLAGSPFEDWLRKTSQQKCMLGNEGRSGTDCGGAGNQSIYQRSLGLIWEMAGRSQANKRITVGDLLDFAVLENPCTDLDPPVSCDGQVASFCSEHYDSDDYACDAERNVCIATRGTPTCNALTQAQQQERQESITLAEDAVAGDYTCPDAEPAAACHAYDDTYPAAFMLAEGATEAAIQPGHLLDMPDVGRAFGRALTHEFVIEVPNPWVRRYLEDVARATPALALPTCAPGDIDDPTVLPTRNSDGAECVPDAARLSRDVYEDMPDSVDTLGELIEYLLDDSTLFQGDADTAALRPDVKALSRVLFAPPGSSSFIVFDPLLVQRAPAACTAELLAGGTPECVANQGSLDAAGSCCLKSLEKPPLRYRLDTYYGATTFSWEHEFRFQDGRSLSFIDAMKTVADAVNRTDFDAAAGDDPSDFESTDFVFSTLGKLVAEHYDSPDNPLVQSTDPAGMHYRRLTNLVSYEAMMADALDDGQLADAKVDDSAFSGAGHTLGLLYHSLPLLELLDGLDFGLGRDGIDVSADLLELTLSAHASCAGPEGDRRVLAGKGACHRAEAGQAGLRAPLTYRDGRATICWEDGRCFDGPADRRFVSPLYLMVDALGAVDDALGTDVAARDALDLGTGGLLDTYAHIEDHVLSDRRLHALAVALLEHTRERWAEESAAGKLAALRADFTSDAVDAVQSPLLAGGLTVLSSLLEKQGSLESAAAFLHGVLDEGSQPDSVRALVTGAADYFEMVPADAERTAALRALSGAILPGAAELLAGKPAGPLAEGVTWQNLTLMSDTAALDEAGVLPRVLASFARAPAGRHSPAQVFISILSDLQRAEPGSRASLDRDDFRRLLADLAEVMSDEERGFERLYRIVQCRAGGADCR